jgi:peptidoglycan/LPS O-acetylase OafA/YrhL
MILAELSMIYNPSAPFMGSYSRIKNGLATYVPFFAATLGLYLMSYPDRDHFWMSWSAQLAKLGQYVFPHDSDIVGFWPAIGAQIFCFAVFFSPPMRRALSHPFLLYLGGISFPLYLLHGPLMRSVLAWMAYGPGRLRWRPDPGVDAGPYDIPAVGPWALLIILPLFWTLLAIVVITWTQRMEPLMAKATKRLEEFTRG